MYGNGLSRRHLFRKYEIILNIIASCNFWQIFCPKLFFVQNIYTFWKLCNFLMTSITILRYFFSISSPWRMIFRPLLQYIFAFKTKQDYIISIVIFSCQIFILPFHITQISRIFFYIWIASIYNFTSKGWFNMSSIRHFYILFKL